MGERPSSFRSCLSFITANEEETKKSCGRGGKDQRLHERPSSVRVLYAARYVPCLGTREVKGASQSVLSRTTRYLSPLLGEHKTIGGQA